jgi:hypothetical protein
MERDSFILLAGYTPHVEAPSKALQEKCEAWFKAEANRDKSMHDFLLWIQEEANHPHNGLTNRQRREWVRKERRLLSRRDTENILTIFSKLIKRFPEGS